MGVKTVAVIYDSYRHKKRGGTYVVTGIARLQMSGSEHDGKQVVIYKANSDGSVWVRLRSEFEDGRFEAL